VLSSVPGLTHSGTVRLVARHGRDMAARILRTREKSLTSALSRLSPDEIGNLASALDTMLTTVTLARAEQRSARSNDRSQPWLCRLCDFAACGRSEGNCPVDNAVTTRKGS